MGLSTSSQPNSFAARMRMNASQRRPMRVGSRDWEGVSGNCDLDELPPRRISFFADHRTYSSLGSPDSSQKTPHQSHHLSFIREEKIVVAVKDFDSPVTCPGAKTSDRLIAIRLAGFNDVFRSGSRSAEGADSRFRRAGGRSCRCARRSGATGISHPARQGAAMPRTQSETASGLATPRTTLVLNCTLRS